MARILIKLLTSNKRRMKPPLSGWSDLEKNLQLYSGLDPDTPVGEALLKTQFVAKSWSDIRKKLEKTEDWQDKGLDELLREAQKVYVRREEETNKRQVRMMVAAVREGQRMGPPKGRFNSAYGRREQRNEIGKSPEGEKRREITCFYCGKKRHLKKDCRKRIMDEKMFKEE